MSDEKDPLLEFATVEDEDLKAGKLPEAELNPTPPEDAPERERNEDGTFKGEKKKEEQKPEKKAEPEQKAELKPEVKPEQKKDDFVPLAKFLDDRAKYKAELEQRDLTIKQISDRLAAFEKKHAPEPEPEPDFIDDPKAYVDHKLSNTLARLEAANKETSEQGKQAAETAARARETAETQIFLQRLGAHEQQYAAKNPDYFEAIDHMRGIRRFQLQRFAPGMTEEQIEATITQEEIGLAMNLARAGQDPCATAHELARRYGYAPKAQTPPAPKPTPPTGALPPDQSLGGGHGAPDLSSEEDEKPDPVAIALASLTRRRA